MPAWFIPLSPPTHPFDTSPPTYREIAAIVNKMKNGASPCPFDQLSAIALKRCPILRTLLHLIIDKCWSAGKIPRCWARGVTILIYKKGDPSLVENFRPITLQSVAYKVYSTFLRNRIQEFLRLNNYCSSTIQKGFTQGQDGVSEHSELLNHILKDAKRHQRSLFVVLLDLRNAFGEIQHNLIRSSMRYHNVHNKFIEAFDSIYNNFYISVSCSNT